MVRKKDEELLLSLFDERPLEVQPIQTWCFCEHVTLWCRLEVSTSIHCFIWNASYGCKKVHLTQPLKWKWKQRCRRWGTLTRKIERNKQHFRSCIGYFELQCWRKLVSRMEINFERKLSLSQSHASSTICTCSSNPQQAIGTASYRHKDQEVRDQVIQKR